MARSTVRAIGHEHVTDELVREAVQSRGFTIDPITKATCVEGFAVSIYPEHEHVIRPTPGTVRAQLTRADITNYLDRKLEFMRVVDGAHVGGWVNAEDGCWYLDVTHVVSDEHEARALAAEHGQMAIYDLKGRREIDTRHAGRIDARVAA